MDWGHESKSAFPNIADVDLFETYSGHLMNTVRDEFKAGCYDRFKMCGKCADELGFYKADPANPPGALARLPRRLTVEA